MVEEADPKIISLTEFISVNLIFGKYIQVCISVCEAGGEIIREVSKSGKLQIEEKGVDDPFTIADLTVQTMILQTLKNIYPALKIIGEEEEEEYINKKISFSEPIIRKDIIPIRFFEERPPIGRSSTQIIEEKLKLEDCILWVDPVDGTKEFIAGNLQCCTILLGLSICGKPEVGITHFPCYNMHEKENLRSATYFGTPYHGIYKQYGDIKTGKKTEFESVKLIVTEPEEIIVCTTSSRYSDQLKQILALLGPEENIVKTGGAGNKLVMMIENEVNSYVYPTCGCKPWDLCPGEVFLKAQGGKLTDCLGEDIHYDQAYTVPGVLAGLTSTIYASIWTKIAHRVKSLFHV